MNYLQDLNKLKKSQLIELIVNERGALIRDPRDVNDYLQHAKHLMTDFNKEHFIILCLNSKNKIIKSQIVHIGTTAKSFASTKDCFKIAILANAAGVIIAHNHPSDDPEPSENDDKITKKFIQAGEILDIPVLDHVIFCRSYKHYSYSNAGKMHKLGL